MPDFETRNELRQHQDDERAKDLRKLQKRHGVHPTLSNKPDAVAKRAAKVEAEDEPKPIKQRSMPSERAFSASH